MAVGKLRVSPFSNAVPASVGPVVHKVEGGLWGRLRLRFVLPLLVAFGGVFRLFGLKSFCPELGVAVFRGMAAVFEANILTVLATARSRLSIGTDFYTIIHVLVVWWWFIVWFPLALIRLFTASSVAVPCLE